MPTWHYEHEHGGHNIAGVDEVGRGCLAGPVVAAAVIIGTDIPNTILKYINDSKKLSPNTRAAIAQDMSPYITFGLGVINEATIERVNIHCASLLAMAQALASLPQQPTHVLIDGKYCPPVSLPCTALIQGDSKSYSIAAASIMAKVHRDTLLRDLSQHYPQYGWERNAGYGTKQHIKALHQYGVTPHHRRGYSPIAALFK